MGIKASLGWNTEEVDKLVVQAAGTVALGDYTRACMLMEKAVYGGTELKPYDERVLIGFRGKLYRAGISSDLRTRLKFRYFGLYRIWRKIRK